MLRRPALRRCELLRVFAGLSCACSRRRRGRVQSRASRALACRDDAKKRPSPSAATVGLCTAPQLRSCHASCRQGVVELPEHCAVKSLCLRRFAPGMRSRFGEASLEGVGFCKTVRSPLPSLRTPRKTRRCVLGRVAGLDAPPSPRVSQASEDAARRATRTRKRTDHR